MRNRIWALTGVFMLAACGGGGGEPDAVISASTDTVSATARSGELAPSASVVLTVTNPPEDVFVGYQFGGSAISQVQLEPVSQSEAVLRIFFRNANDLPAGTYPDWVLFSACLDRNCSRELTGSPIRINTTLQVVHTDPNAGVRTDPTNLEVSAETFDPAPQRIVAVTFTGLSETAVFTRLEHGNQGIANATYRQLTANTGEIAIQYRSPADVGNGNHYDQILLTACWDAACTQPIGNGSAFVGSQYLVSGPAIPNRDPLPITRSRSLSNDVIDAEYSSALEAIVTVGAYPSNRLYVYDTITGEERSVTLNKVPTSVSVSPSGLQAAVGHDALITVVDLTNLQSRVLNVSAPVLDIVLADNGYVYAFPSRDQWSSIHSVAIASNTETVSAPSIYAGTLARLHPNGNVMYGADNGLSPSDIEKYSIADGPVAILYDSPYHGDYAMCGNLWFSENGASIYTACGNVFRSSPSRAQDMVYNGALQLSNDDSYGFYIRSLSQSAEAREIALIEQQRYCYPVVGECVSHINIYESDFLNPAGSFALPIQTIGGRRYVQQPLFIFHSADGNTRHVVSRTLAMPNPEAEFYIHTLD